MTPKREAFVREYLVDLNATQAAIRAGYSQKTAGQIGDELLKKPEIKAALKAGISARAERVEITADFVLGGLKEVALRCMERVPVMVGSGKERRQLTFTTTDPKTGEEITANAWTFDSAGANRSLELLGKHLGVFDQAEDPDTPPPTQVTVNIVDGRKA